MFGIIINIVSINIIISLRHKIIHPKKKNINIEWVYGLNSQEVK